MNLSAISSYLSQFYHPAQYPALLAQIEQWHQSRPFDGIKILDGTPVFRNTMVKYLALLAGGADVTVAVGDGILCDEALLPVLKQFGFRIADAAAKAETYDIVLDCAGKHVNTPSRYGKVELTRSGAYAYEHAPYPVFLADHSRIKEIETGLGTGDGFRRGLLKFNLGDMKNQHIVLFGCGKVGRGIALYALSAGAQLTVVDCNANLKLPRGAKFVNLSDRAGVEQALRSAWGVVTATGICGALQDAFAPEILLNSPAWIANMGVEDEFGTALPESRVLNGKKPLNFALEEPTQLKFIDPTMALDNLGALSLLHDQLKPGLNLPTPEQEKTIIETIRHGEIAPDLQKLEDFFK